MADDPTPTTSRRELGQRLRTLRRRTGKTAQDVGRDLRFSISKVSRFETGDRAVQEADLAVLLRYYGVVGVEAEHLHALAEQGRRKRAAAPQPVAESSDDITIRQPAFLDLERDATLVREFNGGVVPGLLQTPDYMRAAIKEAAPETTADLIENAMSLRLRRQGLLQDGRCYEVLVDESVLWRVVGDAAIMGRQIAAIRRAMAEKLVSFRVLPLDVGAHPAVNTMFVFLQASDRSTPGVVFSEGLEGQIKIDRLEDVQRFDRIWLHLASLAERSAATDERLADLLMRYRTSSEGRR